MTAPVARHACAAVAVPQGRTGYPMVDAVVRCLLRGGWINFRMRAMVFSFAAYHLWLHWRFTADFMAKHFIGECGRAGARGVAVGNWPTLSVRLLLA